MVAEAAFGIVSGVVICRPGGSYPGSLLLAVEESSPQVLEWTACNLTEDVDDMIRK